ncbi:hypothetical protein B0I37DRAFT_379597 [Chaetomium sp. MPI-CAGE-AT-0009]|nr:hypothetical protein B0I37DRAFT_379597 [Chaetomium sp. MPI-CAGE-AT-0009]
MRTLIINLLLMPARIATNRRLARSVSGTVIKSSTSPVPANASNKQRKSRDKPPPPVEVSCWSLLTSDALELISE